MKALDRRGVISRPREIGRNESVIIGNVASLQLSMSATTIERSSEGVLSLLNRFHADLNRMSLLDALRSPQDVALAMCSTSISGPYTRLSCRVFVRASSQGPTPRHAVANRSSTRFASSDAFSLCAARRSVVAGSVARDRMTRHVRNSVKASLGGRTTLSHMW
jgi:hypothetical protein